jgi:BirA family biotin operon repressor/biotin-[acetyl-CoA-carboxylase] ligase
MTEQEIRAHLTTKIFGKRIMIFDSLPSTNTHAKSLAINNAEEGTIVIAEEQTAGRGRLGRSWHTEPGKNLTFSLIIQPHLSPDHVGIISLYASVAVTSALTTVASVQLQCKWPNDVLINGRKCCGILSETTFTDGKISYVVIGIGVNINQSEFPPELASLATSLFLETGKCFDRTLVLAAILQQMESMYPLITSGRSSDIINQWQEHTTMFGNEVTINQDGRLLRGTALRLAEDGGLIIATQNGEVKVLAGDVSLQRVDTIL